MEKGRDFVLVHGAWHGAWCWKQVRERLWADGHRVYTPTLTGLGARSHLMSRKLTLNTHIADIANVLEWEDLHDVMLVGHSYGGWIAAGVAELQAERIASLVNLDGHVPQDGQDLMNNGLSGSADVIRKALDDGLTSWPAPPVEIFGLMNPKDARWVEEKMTPHPLTSSIRSGSPAPSTGCRGAPTSAPRDIRAR
jgi:pimeloyl-ACP methyl ester carboxylesterase